MKQTKLMLGDNIESLKKFAAQLEGFRFVGM